MTPAQPVRAADRSLVRPFAAIRVAAQHAAEVIAPPYDVVTTEDARRIAADKPRNFLHASRPEIDFRPGTDPHAPAVYAHAGQVMARMLAEGVLVRDSAPAFYVYRMEAPGHVQTGIAAAGSMAAYRENRIRRHELTRPDKEDDRVRQIEAVRAHTGPVFCVHRRNAALAALAERIVAAGPPAADALTPDEMRHRLWPVFAPADVAAIQAAFDREEAIYIADGHHRSAAAARVAESERSGFLVISFPEDEVRILDYNRLVRDLAGQTPLAFLGRLNDAFEVTESAAPVRPAVPGLYGMYMEGRWRTLRLRSHAAGAADPVARLDISRLTRHLLTPLLGIGDPRVDPRIDFVGGSRSVGELVRRVDSGAYAVAFTVRPTTLAELMAVADAGLVMPPKSTWFEPKLADGLLALALD